MADTEEHRHRERGLHGPVHGVPGYGQPPELDKRARRSRHREPLGHLRRPGAELHIRAHLRHKEAHRQVDSMPEHAVLRAIHRPPVLPQVLHFGARWCSIGFGRGSHVDGQGDLPDTGWRCLRQAGGRACGCHCCEVLRVLLPCMADRRTLGEPHLLAR